MAEDFEYDPYESHFDRFNEMIEFMQQVAAEEKNYLYRAFVEDENRRPEDWYMKDYYVALGQCPNLQRCNRSVLPAAIENLSRFLAGTDSYDNRDYIRGLWEQTDVAAATTGSATELLRDIHDNLEQDVDERVIRFEFASEWEEFLKEALGDREVPFLKERPNDTSWVKQEWTYEQLLQFMFGNQFRFVNIDMDTGTVHDMNPATTRLTGFQVVFTVWDRRIDEPENTNEGS